jgi:hypothetical protein
MPKYITQNTTKRAKLNTKAEASCDTHYRDFTVVEEGRKPALAVVNIDPDSQFTAASPPPSNPLSVGPNGSGTMLKTGMNLQCTPSISGQTVAANEKTIFLINTQLDSMVTARFKTLTRPARASSSQVTSHLRSALFENKASRKTL